MRTFWLVVIAALAEGSGIGEHSPSVAPTSRATPDPDIFSNWYRREDGVGSAGGICTCPNGGTYEVGELGPNCASLACIGGMSGLCSEGGISLVNSGMQVTCETGTPTSVPSTAPSIAPTTVAPTTEPTMPPTGGPIATLAPTTHPSTPTSYPTFPTAGPTHEPTEEWAHPCSGGSHNCDTATTMCTETFGNGFSCTCLDGFVANFEDWLETGEASSSSCIATSAPTPAPLYTEELMRMQSNVVSNMPLLRAAGGIACLAVGAVLVVFTGGRRRRRSEYTAMPLQQC